MSEIRTNLLSDLTGTKPAPLLKQSAAKAWCHIKYVSGVPSTVSSFNVSSVDDIGVGNAIANVINAFTSSNFPVFSNNSDTVSGMGVYAIMNSVSALRTHTRNNTPADIDHGRSVSCFGDLA